MRLPRSISSVSTSSVWVMLIAGVALGGCSSDPQEAYCDAVSEHQADLTEIAASQEPTALFDALKAYDELAAKAPRDIADDWSAVTEPLHQLEDSLAAAGVDPSTYSAEKPPKGLSAQDRTAIESAARAVGSQQALAGMTAVEQHALDVCGEPLSR